MNNDGDDNSAVVSLPARLDHVLDVDLDSSIASAPSLLQSHSIIHSIQLGSTLCDDGNHYHDGSAFDRETSIPDCDFQSNKDLQGEKCSGAEFDTTTPSDVGSSPASRYGRREVAAASTNTSTTSRVLVHARKQLAAMHHRTDRQLVSESKQHSPVSQNAENQNSNDEDVRRNNEIVREESFHDLLLYKNPSQDTVNSFDTTSSSLQSSVISSIICLRKRTIAPKLSADVDEELVKNNDGKVKEKPHLFPSEENAKSCGNDLSQAGEGEGTEYTLFDFEDNIALDDFLSTLQTSPSSSKETSAQKSSTVHWSDEELLFQPDLQEDPSGLTFSFDRMFQCFDASQDQISISPQTFYSLPCSDFDDYDDEILNFGDGVGHQGVDSSGMDCFMPSCCHDDFADLNDLAQLDESTIGEDDDFRDIQSKGSLLESYSYNSESIVEGLLKHLELERKSDGDGVNNPEDKLDLRNETMATEGDSTLNDSTMMY